MQLAQDWLKDLIGQLQLRRVTRQRDQAEEPERRAKRLHERASLRVRILPSFWIRPCGDRDTLGYIFFSAYVRRELSSKSAWCFHVPFGNRDVLYGIVLFSRLRIRCLRLLLPAVERHWCRYLLMLMHLRVLVFDIRAVDRPGRSAQSQS